MSKWSGLFLVLDGIDGCGKSTQAKLLFEYFVKAKIPVKLTTEPSQGDLGKILRKCLKDPTTPAALDALLFAADRVEHCHNEILPFVTNGEIVITDRYIDSSLVYQSIQGEKQGLTMEWVRELNKYCLIPDISIILDLDPEIALSRKVQQNNSNPDSMEKFEQLEFQRKIRTVFLELAKSDREGKHYVITTNKSIPEVFQEILSIILPELKLKQILK